MAELLRVEGLCSGYGQARVVNNVSFALAEGKSLALLGRNGVGKTTTLKAIMGIRMASSAPHLFFNAS